ANVGNEIQNDDLLLGFGQTQTSSKLLHKNAATMCDPLKDHDVHIGKINTFIQNIHRAQHSNQTVMKITQYSVALGWRHRGPTSPRRIQGLCSHETESVDPVAHRNGVIYGAAENQRPRMCKLVPSFTKLKHDRIIPLADKESTIQSSGR